MQGAAQRKREIEEQDRHVEQKQNNGEQGLGREWMDLLIKAN